MRLSEHPEMATSASLGSLCQKRISASHWRLVSCHMFTAQTYLHHITNVVPTEPITNLLQAQEALTTTVQQCCSAQLSPAVTMLLLSIGTKPKSDAEKASLHEGFHTVKWSWWRAQRVQSETASFSSSVAKCSHRTQGCGCKQVSSALTPQWHMADLDHVRRPENLCPLVDKDPESEALMTLFSLCWFKIQTQWKVFLLKETVFFRFLQLEPGYDF